MDNNNQSKNPAYPDKPNTSGAHKVVGNPKDKKGSVGPKELKDRVNKEKSK